MASRGSEIQSDCRRLWLDSDRAGIHAVEVALRRVMRHRRGPSKTTRPRRGRNDRLRPDPSPCGPRYTGERGPVRGAASCSRSDSPKAPRRPWRSRPIEASRPAAADRAGGGRSASSWDSHFAAPALHLARIGSADADEPSTGALVLAPPARLLVFVLVAVGAIPRSWLRDRRCRSSATSTSRCTLDGRHPSGAPTGLFRFLNVVGGGIVTIPLRAVVSIYLLARRCGVEPPRSSSPGRPPSSC